MVDYIEIIINGMCTGIGVAVGTYFANSYFIKRIQDLEIRLKQLSQKSDYTKHLNTSMSNI